MKTSATLCAGLAAILLLPRVTMAQPQNAPADPFVGNYLAGGDGQPIGPGGRQRAQLVISHRGDWITEDLSFFDDLHWAAESRFRYKEDGQDYPGEAPTQNSIAVERVGPRQVRQTEKHNGRVVARNQVTLSDDGKTLNVEHVAVDEASGTERQPEHILFRRTGPEATEFPTPVPRVVAPAAAPNAAPADAIVLFDGTNLDEWVSAGDHSPAKWTVADGIVTVVKSAGNIETKRKFTNYQLHLEWRVPENVTGQGQARGNSGLFLASTGPGDAGYELQILDSYNNPTYVNGQAASVYKQYIPLVNASRKPGEWQTYDVIWTAPLFNDDGTVKSRAYVTAFHNGVLVQNHVELKGETIYIGAPQYKRYTSAPIKLQAHGDPSPPISFRNIWVRDLTRDQ